MPLGLLLQQVVDVFSVGTFGVRGVLPFTLNLGIAGTLVDVLQSAQKAADLGVELTSILGNGGNVGLSAFIDIVRLEEAIIDRARGAFLTQWFGTGLPLEGRSAKIVIDNLAALQARYTTVMMAVKTAHEEAMGPNLLEPLAGIAGTLVGVLLSPTGVTTIVAVVVRKLPRWARILSTALGAAAGFALGYYLFANAGISGLVLVGVGAGAGVAGGLAGGAIGDLYDLLGAGTRLIIAANQFFEMLRDRDKVKNPLLIKILGVFDRIAALLPFVLAFVAVVVTRVGRLLAPLAEQIVAFKGIIATVSDAVGLLLEDLKGRLKHAYDKGTPLHVLVVLLKSIGDVFKLIKRGLSDAIGDLFDSFSRSFEVQWSLAGRNARTWMRQLKTSLPGFVKLHPLYGVIDRLKREVLLFRSALDVPPRQPSKKAPDPDISALAAQVDGYFSRATAVTKSALAGFPVRPQPDSDALMKLMGGSPTSALDVDSLKKVAERLPAGLFSSLALSDGARRSLQRAEHPPSVFAAQWRGLEKQAATYVLRSDEEARLRGVVLSVTDRLLPDELREYVPVIHQLFEELDQDLRRVRELPVKRLAEHRSIRPVVRKLTVRVHGATEVEALAFTEKLTALLTRDPYFEPVS